MSKSSIFFQKSMAPKGLNRKVALNKKVKYTVYLTWAARWDTTKYYRTHYNQRCCLHWMRRDTTRQIPHSKLPRPIYDVLTQSSNFLCRQGPCTWRPMDFPFEIRKPKSGIERSLVFVLILKVEKWENGSFFGVFFFFQETKKKNSA